MQVAARPIRVTLQSLEARSPDELEHTLAVMGEQRPDALITTGDPLLNLNMGRITEVATKNRVPSMYNGRDWVESGGLASYGTSVPDLYRRAAGYVDKILRVPNQPSCR